MTGIRVAIVMVNLAVPSLIAGHAHAREVANGVLTCRTIKTWIDGCVALINIMLTIFTLIFWRTETGVIVDTIHASSTVEAHVLRAIIEVYLTCISTETT